MGELVVKSGELKQLVIVHESPDTTEQVIRLQKNAEIVIDEIFLANAKSKIKVIHEAGSKSLIKSRGVVSKGVLQAHATIVIPKDAQRCESFVSQKFVLLDKSAVADVVPALEIEASDVKAGHASSIAPLDEEKVFYLTSRGISEQDAKKLLIEGLLQHE